MYLISIIVPCYNQAQYLDECLQSVLDQTYEYWECIIVNDGSPDNTEETAQRWTEKDKRFKYLSQENGGVSAARNFAIKNANGTWILPLDGDDKIESTYLELAQKYFENENVKVITCHALKFGKENTSWKLHDFQLRDLAIENMLFCSSFFKRKDALEIGGYDADLVKGYEDWEFWIHLLKNGGEVIRLEDVCFHYRIHEVSRNREAIKNNNSIVRYIEKKHLDFFHEQLGTINSLYNENRQKEKILDLVINKRYVSRFVNQIYSAIEILKTKIK